MPDESSTGKEISLSNPVMPGKCPGPKKFETPLETASMYVAELSEYCRRNGLYPERISAWRETCRDVLGLSQRTIQRWRHNLIDARKVATNKRQQAIEASGPNQVLSWYITYLPTMVKGVWFYLYMIMDICSRKIVGWEIFDRESADNASLLIRKTYLKNRDDVNHLMSTPKPVNSSRFFMVYYILSNRSELCNSSRDPSLLLFGRQPRRPTAPAGCSSKRFSQNQRR